MTRTNSKTWLLIDYDDTLGGVLIQGKVQNNDVAYTIAIDEFVWFMEYHYGIDEKEARKIQEEVDITLCKLHGFSVRDRFAQSLVTAFYWLTVKYQASITSEHEQSVFAIGESVFQYPYVALPGALDTLERLKHKYHIAVVTKGNGKEQNKKILDSGVSARIDRIYSVGRKDERDWWAVLNDLGLGLSDLSQTWAIGNSSKSDVNVPLRIGMNGIWVAQGGWAFESEPLETPARGRKLHQVKKIHEILNYL